MKEKEMTISNIKKIINLYKQKVSKLQEQNANLKKVVEFYASEDSWSGWHRDVDVIKNDTEPAKAADGFDIMLGGKLARQTLKDLDKNDAD